MHTKIVVSVTVFLILSGALLIFIIENIGSIDSGNNPSISPNTKDTAKYARVKQTAFPHFPDNLLRASSLKSDETIVKSPFHFFMYILYNK